MNINPYDEYNEIFEEIIRLAIMDNILFEKQEREAMMWEEYIDEQYG